MKISADEAAAVLAGAQRLYTRTRLETELERMASEIGARIAGTDPVLLCMMVGGLITTTQITTRLWFPLEIDYLHVTRYRGGTQGGAPSWLRKPAIPLAGRNVLLIDDILDEGHTLLAARQTCLELGAAKVLSAVLVQKRHSRRVAGVEADFTGVTVDDRYVFGYGMDYKGYWRNLPDIYAAV
jgi:hypoxanthine phosphoribosyltransferase